VLMDIETIIIKVYNECKTWPLVLLEVDTVLQVRIVSGALAMTNLVDASPGTYGPSTCSEVCTERSNTAGEDRLPHEVPGHAVRTSLCIPDSGSCRSMVGTSRRNVRPGGFCFR
jgi:hypothetical protein